MSDRIGEEVRALVVTRAEQRCEYCLIHENDTFFGLRGRSHHQPEASRYK